MKFPQLSEVGRRRLYDAREKKKKKRKRKNTRRWSKLK